MTTPTKDQIAAAKRWNPSEPDPRDEAIIQSYNEWYCVELNLQHILLAALEAAEHRADITNRMLMAYSKVLDVLGAPAEGSDLEDLQGWARELKAKTEAAEADTARLDWLENDGGVFPVRIDGLWYTIEGDECATMRDAIDAARKEAQP